MGVDGGGWGEVRLGGLGGCFIEEARVGELSGRGVFLVLLEVGDVLAEEVMLLDILGGAGLAFLVEGVNDVLLLLGGLLFPWRL